MTEQKYTGGQAFPLQPASMPEMHYLGMTLRDWFAGQALAGVVERCASDTRKNGQSYEDMFAERSYAIADALLEARK